MKEFNTSTVVFSDEQINILTAAINNTAADSKIYKRATILNALNNGTPIRVLADKFNLSTVTIYSLKNNFLACGEKALHDGKKSGRPCKDQPFTTEEAKELLKSNPPHANKWSWNMLAEQLGTTKYAVKKALRSEGLSIHDQDRLLEFDITGKNENIEVYGCFITKSQQVLILNESEAVAAENVLNITEPTILVTKNDKYQIIEQKSNFNCSVSLWSSLTCSSGLFSVDEQDLAELHEEEQKEQETESDITNVNSDNTEDNNSFIPFFKQHFADKKGLNLIIIANGVAEDDLQALGCRYLVSQDINTWYVNVTKSINTLSEFRVPNNHLYDEVKNIVNITEKGDLQFCWYVNQDKDLKITPDEFNNSRTCQVSSTYKIDIYYNIDIENSLNSLKESKNNIDFSVNASNIESLIDDTESEIKKIIYHYTVNSFQESCNDKDFRHISMQGIIGKINVLLPKKITLGLSSNEFLWTSELLMLFIDTISRSPYKNSISLINKLLHRSASDALSYRTINDIITRLGLMVRDIYSKMVNKELEKNGFDTETCTLNDGNDTNNTESNVEDLEEFKSHALKIIEDLIKNSDISLDKEFMLKLLEKNPNNAFYICFDTVYAPHQNETRAVNGKIGYKDSKFVLHANAYIYSKEGMYVITADNVKELAKLTLSYILSLTSMAQLKSRELVFMSDMGQDIRSSVRDIFSKIPGVRIVHILDWYHLVRKINEYFSMVFKGGKSNKDLNHTIKKNIFNHLWYGDVAGAKRVIEGIDPKQIKNKTELDRLLSYLDNRKEYICCYALRKKLGLINSSNRVESVNFWVVTKRQKHNGFSWCNDGSHALASLAALQLNKKLKHFISYREVNLDPVQKEGQIWSVDKVQKKYRECVQ